MKLWVLFTFVNASHLICIVLSVNEPKDGKIRPTFDEIYGKGWDEDVHQKIKMETSPLNSGENALNEQADHDDNIDQDVEAYNSDSTDQNLSQEDPDSTDQNLAREDPDSTDQNLTQEDPDSTDQNLTQKDPDLTDQNLTQEDPDSTDQNLTQEDPDSTDQNLTQEDPDRVDQNDDETIEGINEENEFSEQEKRKIICKFHAMREEYKKKEKVTKKERVKIERKIGKDLRVNRDKIYKWKNEFGLSRKTKRNKNDFYEKKKREFIKRMDEIKKCQPGKQNRLAKLLGISRQTFRCWKKEFGFPIDSQYSDSEKLELMKKYYKIKQTNHKLNVTDIANMLNIGAKTLYRWKKQFDPNLNNNSVDEHLLAEKRQSFANNDTSEHPIPSSNDNLWAWNLAKKKRTERTEVEHSVKK